MLAVYGPPAERITAFRVPEVDGTADRSPLVATVTSVEELWCSYAPGPHTAPTAKKQPIFEALPGSGCCLPAGSSSPPEGATFDGVLVTVEPSISPIAAAIDAVGDEGVFGLLWNLRFEEALATAADLESSTMSDGLRALCAALAGRTDLAEAALARHGPANTFFERASRVLARREALGVIRAPVGATERSRLALLSGAVLVVLPEENEAMSDEVDLVGLMVGRLATALRATGVAPPAWEPAGDRLAYGVTSALDTLLGRGTWPVGVVGRYRINHRPSPTVPLVAASSGHRALGSSEVVAVLGVRGREWTYNDHFDPFEIDARILGASRGWTADRELEDLLAWRIGRPGGLPRRS